MIEQLSNEIIEKFKSEPYLSNRYLIVKELIENSIDATAKHIKIYIEQDCIRVEDDGEGIENLNHVGEEGYTAKEDVSKFIVGSKKSYSDYSHGFRGQALYILSKISDLEISTRVKGNKGYKKTFKSNKIVVFGRENGTTITVKNIFQGSDLRRKLMSKSCKKDIKKIHRLVKSYCIINDINFFLYENNKLIFKEIGSTTVIKYLQRNYNQNFSTNIFEVDNIYYHLYLATNGHRNSECQYIFLDKRIVKIKSIQTTINNTYAMFKSQLPCYVVIVKDKGDFNCSVDKTKVILINEKEINYSIKKEMEVYFSKNLINCTENKTHKKLCILKEKKLNQINKSQTKENINESQIKYDNPDFAQLTRTFDNDISPKKNVKIEKIECSNFDNNILDESDLIVDEAAKCENIFEDNTNENNKVSNTNNINAKMLIKDNVIEKNYNSLDNNINLDFEYIDNKLNDEVHLLKDDFKHMKIIGQFNKGFILTLLHKNNKKYLLIVDQHAADEIKNYEFLQNNFFLKKQKLIVSCPLELNSNDEMDIKTNLHILKRNGFELDEQFRLISVPIYKNTIFNKDDFWDLLTEIRNYKECKNFIFCSKMKDIMASKACRTSVMVGDYLSTKKMEEIVYNLSNLKIPWKCPHGRPVIKVLHVEDCI
ncbi:ATP-binding mismatch repair protein [Conglomerata obtusa]